MARPPLRFAVQVLEHECVRPADLARILDVSVSYVYKCIDAGTLQTLRVGAEHRIRQAEAVRYLESVGMRIAQHAQSA